MGVKKQLFVIKGERIKFMSLVDPVRVPRNSSRITNLGSEGAFLNRGWKAHDPWTLSNILFFFYDITFTRLSRFDL